MSSKLSLEESYRRIEKVHGRPHIITISQIREVFGNTWNKELNSKENRVPGKRGQYQLHWSKVLGAEAAKSIGPMDVITAGDSDGHRQHGGESVEIPETVSFIPEVENTYVKFGHHRTLNSIIKSEIFYPTFVTGLSGNGKTFMVEQVWNSWLKHE